MDGYAGSRRWSEKEKACVTLFNVLTAAPVIPTLPHMTWLIWPRYYDQAKKILGMPLP